MKLKLTQAPAAMSTLRVDGAAVIESDHEVLIRFYFDSPPLPGEPGDWDDSSPDELVVVREIVASMSLSPPAARGLYKSLKDLAHVEE